jgi:amino acid permease
MGSSLLTMPWGIQNAGLLMGIVTIVMMGGLCLYTTHKILQVQIKHGKSDRLIYPSVEVSTTATWNKFIFGLYESNSISKAPWAIIII